MARQKSKTKQPQQASAVDDRRFRSLSKTIVEANPLTDQARLQAAYQHLKECAVKAGPGRIPVRPSDALETAEILTEVNADESTLIAALLHALVADDCSTLKEIEEKFGDEVAGLIEKVTRTSRIKFRSRFEEQAENFRKMILAMAKDLRVVMLHLANRLQRMRHIGRLDQEVRQEWAQESLEIYAPLAHRLGIARIKWELEDICLKILHPSVYQDLAARVPLGLKEREAYIRRVIRILKKEMKEQEIPGDVIGRPKHFYSIYQKIVKRGVSFEEIFDLTALRIITQNKNQCYAVLGIIHSLWTPVPGKFKDYIGVPKSNMYQSLHTTVIGPDGQKVELQIRTEEMHRIAEQGVAAHWKYKEGVKATPALDQTFASLRQLLEWQQELKSPREFMESVKTDLFEESVYVFTPTGDVKELPAGSTPLDFAYSIHTDVGNHCSGAKVDNRMVPLKTPLKTGDTVAVLTSKTQVPSKDWLKMVKSTKARNRIRHFLNQEEQKRSLSLGQEILEKEARKQGLSFSKILKSDTLNEAVRELGFTRVDKMIAAVGFGKLSALHVLHPFMPDQEVPEPGTVKARPSVRKKREGIKIHGFDDILVNFSKCCNPVPGDEVLGFITRGQGVSIHRIHCPNVGGGTVNSDRVVDVQWNLKEETVRPVRISVITSNRPGILADISAKISSEEINISAADIRIRKDGKSVCNFELEIRNRRDLDRILQAISRTRDVLEVKRTASTF